MMGAAGKITAVTALLAAQLPGPGVPAAVSPHPADTYLARMV